MVLKFLAAFFLLIFALMAGVIFGLKSSSTKNSRKVVLEKRQEHFAAPLKAHNKVEKTLLPQEKINPLFSRFKNKERRGYTLVLAAFKTEIEAARYAEEIHNKEKDAFYFPQVIHGQIWYRVGVGSFTLKSTAESLKKELSYYPYGKKSLIIEIPSAK